MGPSIRRPRKHVSSPLQFPFLLPFPSPSIPLIRRCPTHRIAFGHILTRLTAAKEAGAFITTPDGNKVALGIPQAQKDARAGAGDPNADIPLRRPGTATEAAASILAVASPLFSYVDGQTIMVTGGRNM